MQQHVVLACHMLLIQTLVPCLQRKLINHNFSCAHYACVTQPTVFYFSQSSCLHSPHVASCVAIQRIFRLQVYFPAFMCVTTLIVYWALSASKTPTLCYWYRMPHVQTHMENQSCCCECANVLLTLRFLCRHCNIISRHGRKLKTQCSSKYSSKKAHALKT